MTEAVNISVMSVNFYVTIRCNIPDGCNLHTCRRENLKTRQSESSSDILPHIPVVHVISFVQSFQRTLLSPAYCRSKNRIQQSKENNFCIQYLEGGKARSIFRIPFRKRNLKQISPFPRWSILLPFNPFAYCYTLWFVCSNSVCHLLWRHALMGAMQDGGVKTFDRRVFPLFSEQTGGLPAFWGRNVLHYCLIPLLFF
jgi:hypothetical protein